MELSGYGCKTLGWLLNSELVVNWWVVVEELLWLLSNGLVVEWWVVVVELWNGGLWLWNGCDIEQRAGCGMVVELWNGGLWLWNGCTC